MYVIGLVLTDATMQVEANFPKYRAGAIRLSRWSHRYVDHLCPTKKCKDAIETTVSRVVDEADSLLMESARAGFEAASSGAETAVLTAIFYVFWMSSPIKVASFDNVIRRYVFIKSAACCLFGFCSGFWLWVMGLDLAWTFGLLTAMLAFIPEIGAFVGLLMPVPILLLDNARDDWAMWVIVTVIGMVALKFLFGNVIEVMMVESDEIMKMHPVVCMFCIVALGCVWGPAGMLLSVPLIAVVKGAAVLGESSPIPQPFRNWVIIMIEGDATAPLRAVAVNVEGRTQMCKIEEAGQHILASQDDFTLSGRPVLRRACNLGSARTTSGMAMDGPPKLLRGASTIGDFAVHDFHLHSGGASSDEDR
eukprot:CAMPEP_0204341926 /NCGR_PEP_ID=MMETSP0469-20131031/23733_1 /ASSEMBLY_ACC=CAM_ASM_000384 /TAXON_ID=2969 /ORGANISM="Oxyrrhis marina" /LENGTH=362 /DNA_ID=CAMNT_0051326739 /DNA_START=49 /DNA_END=1137 /DNA_ORIENTATION=-